MTRRIRSAMFMHDTMCWEVELACGHMLAVPSESDGGRRIAKGDTFDCWKCPLPLWPRVWTFLRGLVS